MSSDTDTQQESNFVKLSNSFIAKRKAWLTDLAELISDINNISKLPLSQVIMLKYRHDLTDNIATLQSKVNAIDSKLLIARKDRLNHYKTRTQITYNSFGEFNTVINADLNSKLQMKDMLETQINYYRETRDTLDKMGFAIKNRIAILQIEGQ